MILFVLPLFSGGGAERVSINLLKELHKYGYSVGILVFKSEGPLLSMIPKDIPLYNLNTKTLRRSILPLIKEFYKLKPKVVFSTLGYVNIVVLIIGKLLPGKINIWIREANIPSLSIPNNKYPKLFRFMYKTFYGKADKVIYTSTIMKHEFVSDFSINSSVLEFLPNPVDTSFINCKSNPVKYFDKGGIRYVASGRLTYQKGFDRLILWFSKVDNKKSTLTILGDGLLKDELMIKAKSLGVYNRVKFVGFCNNPWKWYSGADAFLLTSRWEGMPNSVLESLACGTMVIATNESAGVNDVSLQVENNSVIIVSTAQQFIYAMNKVKIKQKNKKHKSLLPAMYKKENAVSIFKGWLDEVL